MDLPRRRLALEGKRIALQLCTCTWIEIMTAVGISLYLLLQMQDVALAALSAALFAPLIAFHFAVTKLSNRSPMGNADHGRKGGKHRALSSRYVTPENSNCACPQDK